MVNKITTPPSQKELIDKVNELVDGKADTDLVNVTDSGKILMSSMGMPSNKYTSLTLGASGSTYTAPTNGYFALAGTSNSGSNNYAHVQLQCANIVTRSACTAPSARVAVYIPVKKGDTVQVTYQNVTDTNFIFKYAEGSKSEAS